MRFSVLKVRVFRMTSFGRLKTAIAFRHHRETVYDFNWIILGRLAIQFRTKKTTENISQGHPHCVLLFLVS